MIISETYIMGDYNVNYSITDHLERYRVENMETKFNLKQLITSYTRVTQHTSTIIDWIYTDSVNILNSGVIDLNITDHFPIFFDSENTEE